MKYSAIALFLGAASATHEGSLNKLNNPRDEGIIDALTPPYEACEPRLWIDSEEMEWQMDQFSRGCDIKNYENSLFIGKKLGKKPPRVHAFELNDAAFSFPRVRRYDEVQANMDMLEHFQDNLNTNISNAVNADNFVRVCKTVRAGFNNKYHNGEYDDPATTDPRAVAEGKKPALEWKGP